MSLTDDVTAGEAACSGGAEGEATGPSEDTLEGVANGVVPGHNAAAAPKGVGAHWIQAGAGIVTPHWAPREVALLAGVHVEAEAKGEDGGCGTRVRDQRPLYCP